MLEYQAEFAIIVYLPYAYISNKKKQVFEMEALIIVLNHEKHLDALLEELEEKNIRGGTILESEGMVSALYERSAGSIFPNYRLMLNKGRPFNKTLFLLLHESRIEIAKACVRSVVGDLNEENVGIMFTLPVTSFEGLTK